MLGLWRERLIIIYWTEKISSPYIQRVGNGGAEVCSTATYRLVRVWFVPLQLAAAYQIGADWVMEC